MRNKCPPTTQTAFHNLSSFSASLSQASSNIASHLDGFIGDTGRSASKANCDERNVAGPKASENL